MNILCIMLDQLRYNVFGFQGYPIETPNIDWLSRQGMVFCNAYSNAPLCAPARLALMTGTYPHENGLWNNDPHTLSPDTPNYVQELKKLGYHTSCIGKVHLYPHNGSIPDMRRAEPLLNSYGFDDVNEIPGPRVSTSILSHMTAGWQSKGLWKQLQDDYADRYEQGPATVRPHVLPLEEYPDIYVGRETCSYLETYHDSKPWFCFVGFGGPHEPWDAPDEYVERYRHTTFPDAIPRFTDSNPDRATGTFDQPLPYDRPTAEHIQEVRRNYAANITLIDEQIGKIIDVVKARGEFEDTAIIFTSDHGEMNGDQDRFYKSNFLESSVHIPLIVRLPGKTVPKESHQLTELMDIGPMITRIGGGESVFCDAQDPLSTVPRDHVLSELNHEYMIRTEEWKIVFNQDLEPYMLFNMVHDPDEQINLAGDQSFMAVEQDLRAMLMGRLDY